MKKPGQRCSLILIAFLLFLRPLAMAQAPSISYPASKTFTTGTAISPLTPTSSGVAAPGYNASPLTIASGLSYPYGVKVDVAGNIYFDNSSTIQKIPAGGGSPVTIASLFNLVIGLAVDLAGNVYATYYSKGTIVKIPAGGGNPVTIGSGFDYPWGVAVDAIGNVYVGGNYDNKITKIPAGGGSSTTVGSGFSQPLGVDVDAAGNVYVTDYGNKVVKKIPVGGGSPIIIGQGFSGPLGLALDAMGNVYVADDGLVKQIPVSGGSPIVIGSGFISYGITVDASGNVYATDYFNGAIKKIVPSGGFNISPALPPGLNFDGATGIISGTPTTVSPATTYTVTAYNSNGGSTSTFSLSVLPPAPVISSFTPTAAGANATITINGSNFLNATAVSFGGTAAKSISVASDTQITAVVGAGASGAVSITTPSGTSTLAGFTFVIPPNITYTSSQTFIQGTTISPITPANTGGAATAYTISPALPAGLGFDTATGIISGTPTVASASTVYTITASNVAGNSKASINLTVLIPLPVFSYSSPKTYIKGTAITPLSPTGNGVASLAYSGKPLTLFSGIGGPLGIAVDAAGNIYFTDTRNVLWKIPALGADPIAIGSGFNNPQGIAVDAAGNIYVAEAGDYQPGSGTVKKISAGGGATTVIAVGLYSPNGVALDAQGNIYVAETGSNLVKKIPLGGGTIVSVGSGFSAPSGLAIDAAGNVYVANAGSGTVMKIPAAGGATITIASGLNTPQGLAVDAAGNIYVACSSDINVKKIAAGSGAITSFLTGLSDSFGVAVDVAGNVYATFPGNQYIAKMPAGDSTPITIAAVLQPNGITTDATGNLYFTDAITGFVKKIPAGGSSPVIIGSGFKYPQGVAVDAAGNIYVADNGNNVVKKIPIGGGSPVIVGTGFNRPAAVTLDAAGNIYVVDYGNGAVKKIPVGGSSAVTIASGFSNPFGMAIDPAGNVYVSDYESSNGAGVVKKIPVGGGSPVTIGSGFYIPLGLAVDAAGNVFVADEGHNAVKEIPAGGGSPVAVGSGFGLPTAITFDAAGNMYVGDTGNYAIYKLAPSGGYYITPALPAGLSFDSSTGIISGTPTVLSPATTYTISAYNSTGGSTATVKINVLPAAPVITSFTPSAAGPGVTITINGSNLLTTTAVSFGGTAAKSFNVVSDTQVTAVLGAGASGLVSITTTGGTGTLAGFTFISPPVITYADNQTFTKGSPISPIYPTNTGGAAIGYSISPALPAGLRLDTLTGAISGKPFQVAATTAYTITAKNKGGNSITTINITIIEIPAPAINYTGPQTYTVGTSITALSPTSTGVATAGLQTSLYSPLSTQPVALTLDATGNIYVAGPKLQKIPAGGGSPTAIDLGPALAAATVGGIATDLAGNLYGIDTGNSNIFKVPAGGGAPFVMMGTGVTVPSGGIAIDGAGNVYVTDGSDNSVKMIPAAGGLATSIFNGNGTLGGIAADASGNIYVADNADGSIIKVPVGGNSPITIASGLSGPHGLAVDGAGNIYFSDDNNTIKEIPAGGSMVVLATATGKLRGVATDVAGNVFYADFDGKAINEIARVGGYYISPALPAGLSFNNATGTITGTPAAASPAKTYTITGFNAGNSATATLNITVLALPAPAISYAGPQVYHMGKAITALAPVNKGGAAAIGYSNSTTNLGADFSGPFGVAVDAAGNIYVADTYNNAVMEIPAGGGSPITLGSDFSNPRGIAVDALGNVYITDSGNGAVKMIPTGGGSPVTLASGFGNPWGIAVDAARNVYVADFSNNVVKKIPVGGGSPITIGSGFFNPRGVAVDAAGNVYVADYFNNAVKKIPVGGAAPITIGSGYNYPGGLAVDAKGNVYVTDNPGNLLMIPANGGNTVSIGSGFNNPLGVAIDAIGNVYVAEQGNNAIDEIAAIQAYTISPDLPPGLSIDGLTGIISGTPKTASASATYTITAINASGTSTATLNLAVLPPAPGISSFTPTVAGANATVTIKGQYLLNATAVSFGGTAAKSFKALSDTVITAVVGAGATGDVSVTSTSGTGTLAGFTFFTPPIISYPATETFTRGIAISPISPTSTGGVITSYSLDRDLPAGLFFDTNTGILYGTPVVAASSSVYTITASNPAGKGTAVINISVLTMPAPVITYTGPQVYVTGKAISTLAPVNKGGAAAAGYSNNTTAVGTGFYGPFGVAVDAAGNIYVADSYNDAVKKIPADGGAPITLGSGFSGPKGIAVDAAGNIYVSDSNNNLVKKIPAGGGAPITLALGLNTPWGIAVDAAGNVYFADYGNSAIKKIPAGGGSPITIGSGFFEPRGVAVDAAGNVYVADYNNNAVKKIPAGGGTPITIGYGYGYPNGIAVDAKGNVYVADSFNNVLEIPVNGDSPFSIGSGFNSPLGIALDTKGTVYVADQGNNAIAKVAGFPAFAISPALPAGLSFDALTGNISGTPTAPSALTTYTITANNAGGSSTTSINITVNLGIAAPTTQATNLKFTNVSSSGGNLSWTNGNGTSRVVFIAPKVSTPPLPLDSITYHFGALASQGTQIGSTGWFCVYNGTGSTTSVAGLKAATLYRFMVMEYNGSAGTEKYLTTASTGNPLKITTAYAKPTVQAINVNFTNTTTSGTTVNWTNGNGTSRVVFIAPKTSIPPLPLDSTAYLPGATAAQGNTIGSSGWFCVYNGTGSSATVTGLKTATAYRFMVLEYNGTTGTQRYLTTLSTNNPLKMTTLAVNPIAINNNVNNLALEAPLQAVDIKIEAANILSPNGDGKNDTWVVKNIDYYPNNMVTVTDQAGRVVYSKKGYTNDWGATYMGGILNEGTYYYLIDLGNGATYKGFITVVRD